MGLGISANTASGRGHRPVILALAGSLILVQVLAGACSSTPKDQSAASKKSVGGVDEQIFIGDSIEKNYDPNVIMKRGEAYFEKEEYAEAIVSTTISWTFTASTRWRPTRRFGSGKVT